MPLDTGGIPDYPRDADEKGASGANESYAPNLNSGADIGQALRAVREHQGRSLEDLAEVTRVRRVYLAAIEAMQLDKLPSRPFTIGYVRAYAGALGLDAEAAVSRFKSDEPVLDEPLRAPVGVRHDGDPRIIALIALAAAVLVAIVLWNVAQRAMSAPAPPPATAPDTAAVRALDASKAGPVSLGAPLPAPVESTTPAPYETPGLAHAQTSASGVSSLDGTPRPADRAADPNAAPAPVLASTFTPQGQVYGAKPTAGAQIVIQALQSASLIIRGADGQVYFARQLAAGEAYRAPSLAGLSLEVSEPQSFQVFLGGQSKGLLPAPKMAVGQLSGSSPQP